MAMRRADYPPNWEDLRAAVRARSGDWCEARCADGQRCDASNHVWIHRRLGAAEDLIACAAEGPDCTGRDADEIAPWPVSKTPIRVVLTVAHTCQDSHCDDLDHLLHLCQLHHLRLDAAQHGRNAAATRRAKRLALQPALIAEGA